MYAGSLRAGTQTELQPGPGRKSQRPHPLSYGSSSPYEDLDLSPEPPGSPTKIVDESYFKRDSVVSNAYEASAFPRIGLDSIPFAGSMARPKARPRGESDLGRPATKLNTAVNGTGANRFGFPPVHENGSSTPVAPRYVCRVARTHRLR
ncbi:MAG: hypothetical protein INR71_00210 [Terriglobus roseus]|nr:hypothetical protein [Terriglobus roseus]